MEVETHPDSSRARGDGGSDGGSAAAASSIADALSQSVAAVADALGRKSVTRSSRAAPASPGEKPST